MDPMSILFPVLSVGGMGVVFGACLGVASEVFKVEEDPRIGQVLECLPGANCGGCGFPGCGGCASAIVAGTAPVNACPVGGAAVAEKVGAIMGVAASSAEPVAAFVKCGGTCDKAKNKYDYFGIDDCNMAVQLAGQGAKSCSYGCLGLGSCKKACAFGAIEIVDGVAVIDKDIANLKIDPYKCIRDYPNDTPIVNVIDTLTGITYPAAILVGTIPAGHVPTDEEILNYTFRGSKRHMDKSTKVKDMQVALPFDRIIIDLGSKSMMLPVNDRFEIEYLS